MSYKLTKEDLRYRKLNTCNECTYCDGKERICKPAKKELDRSYNGIRFTADGYDCALPVSIDSHTSCSYACMYCFSEFLGGHAGKHMGEVKQYNLDKFEKILSGENQGNFAKAVRIALRRDQKRPCAVQLGALCDPFDNIERNQGWVFKFAELVKKYNQPTRISTKGTLFLKDEYLDVFGDPNLFWVAFSIITIDDDLLKLIDVHAPPPSERLKAMERLSKRGVSTSLRFRPLIPNVSDRTPKYPKAYKDLIQAAADSGARAVSMEALFSPGMLLPDAKERWDKLESIIKFNLRDVYKKITSGAGSCTRPSRAYVEDMFLECREITHKNNMVFSVSDPLMKHLNDTGCCCGMKPDDPIWGGWQRENATNAVVEAMKGKKIVGTDYIPKWAKYISKRDMCMIVGPAGMAATNTTWAEQLRTTWNDLKSNRGTLVYFQGLLRPTKLNENGDIIYEYKEPEKHNCKTPVLKI